MSITKSLKWIGRYIRRAPLVPLQFPVSGFELVSDDASLEEERFSAFREGLYYPINIGDVIASKYQTVGKLGFGRTSTVWLARDLQTHRNATLKVYTRGEQHKREFDMYQQLKRGNLWHCGYRHIRTAQNAFTIPRAEGEHHCLVQRPVWDSFEDLLYRNPSRRFSEVLLKAGLMQVFLALDYLHTECKLVHTDIKADNIFCAIEDKSILDAFTQSEIEKPSPRKFGKERTIHVSRRFTLPKTYGEVLLGDYGSALPGDGLRYDDVQPDIYRAPEVMLEAGWSYPIDIWNVGVMIWDLFEGKHMFFGKDPDGKGYSTRAHLAEVIGMLGSPPLELLKCGKRVDEFFGEDGRWIADVPIPQTSLQESEWVLEGESKKEFLRFMRGMLTWRPEDRKTAKELLDDPWLKSLC